MKTKGFLIIGANGSLRAVKRVLCALKPGEVAIALDVVIPDSAFKPTITAEIKIAEKDVTPLLIQTGKLNKIQDVLSNEIGLKVVLQSVEAENVKQG